MKKLLTVFVLIIFLDGCYNDKYDKLYTLPPATTTTCDTSGTLSYANDIEPIIASNCFSPGNGCHDATGSSVSGYNYQTSIISLQSNAQNGSLLSDINFMPTRGHNSMPLNGAQLSTCDIDKITRWANEGAPNN